MCLLISNVRGFAKWNWDGDNIIHQSIVPSSRPVVGSKNRHSYDIDVREFLITERNETMKHTINEAIKKHIQKLNGNWELFLSRTQGAFDYRVDLITAFVSSEIKYVSKKGNDPWQFPDETLFLKTGDCEDIAFLLASLIMASGVSPYNIRVAMGKVKFSENKYSAPDEFEHMWVMYKNEAGHWTLIEPLLLTGKEKGKKKTNANKKTSNSYSEYIPYFLFNDSHLWAVHHSNNRKTFNSFVGLRTQWSKWNPKFAGDVHQTIINQALKNLGRSHWVVQALNRRFSKLIPGVVGPIIDDIDRDVKNYDPRDHFDNGYIDEGWERVNSRLNKFNANNHDLDSFALAAHAIADFYAHSSYVHFAQNINPIPMYETGKSNGGLTTIPDYKNTTFDLSKLTVNPYYWNADIQPRKSWQVWHGKLISGRYAQEDDTSSGLISMITEGPTEIPDELLTENFYERGALPHHNEIAVDEEEDHHGNKLYNTKTEYSRQFRIRKDCAVRHISKAFFDNWKG